jgi:hypothetical protein
LHKLELRKHGMLRMILKLTSAYFKSTIMNNKLITSVIIALLIFGFIAEETKCNFSPSNLIIHINSPTKNAYTTNQTILSITINVIYDPLNGSDNRWIAYSLDGKENQLMTPKYQGVSWSNGFPTSVVTAQATLNGLSEGSHSITISAKYYYDNWINEGNSNVQLTVGYSPEPAITVNSPHENQSFIETSNIPYSINVSVPHPWFLNNQTIGSLFSIGYSMDNNSIVVLAKEAAYNGTKNALTNNLSIEKPYLLLNGTLPTLPTGNHAMAIYVAWAYPSNGSYHTSKSEIRLFSVHKEIAKPLDLITNNLLLILVIIALTFLVIVTSVIIYIKRTKQSKRTFTEGLYIQSLITS